MAVTCVPEKALNYRNPPNIRYYKSHLQKCRWFLFCCGKYRNKHISGLILAISGGVNCIHKINLEVIFKFCDGQKNNLKKQKSW